MLVQTLDYKSMNKAYNHSTVGNTDNTVDMLAFAVDWRSQRYWHWNCCLVLILLVTWQGFES